MHVGGALSGTLRRVSKAIPVPPSLWTIAEVEHKTGLGKDVLRVWERRYGFPVPQRDARGDRLYDQDQLSRLHLIKQLLDAGVRAGGIVPKAEHELRALLAETEDAISPSMEQRFEPWIDLLLRGDTAGMRATLQRERKRQGLESWLSDEIFRLGLWVGQAWQSQRIKVYHEHLFCEVLQAELRKVLAAIQRRAIPQDGPRVLLTTLPTEQHCVGLIAVECLFALNGCHHLSMGTNTPLVEIAQAADDLHADIVALSLSAYSSSRDALAELVQLRQLLPATVELWIGGQAGLLRHKRLPGGLQFIGSARMIPARIQGWRQRH